MGRLKFSRHARNRMRGRRGITMPEVEMLIASPMRTDVDEHGNAHYIGEIRGSTYRVVTALDDPDLVVTIHRWDRS